MYISDGKVKNAIMRSQDQFELLFVKLGASCKACLTSVRLTDDGCFIAVNFYDIVWICSIATVAGYPHLRRR